LPAKMSAKRLDEMSADSLRVLLADERGFGFSMNPPSLRTQ